MAEPVRAALAPGDAAGLPSVQLLRVRGNHDEAGRWHALLPPQEQLLRVGPVAVLVVPTMGAAASTPSQAEATARSAAAAARSDAWAGAAVRLVAVHVPPCVTHWEAAAWAAGEKDDPDRSRRVLLALLPELAAPAHAVLAGHSHLYARRRWRWRRGPGGTVPVVTLGAGGGSLEQDPPVDTCPGHGVTVLGRHAISLLHVAAGGAGPASAVLETIDQRGEPLDAVRLV